MIKAGPNVLFVRERVIPADAIDLTNGQSHLLKGNCRSLSRVFSGS